MAKKNRRISITQQIMNEVIRIQNEKTVHNLSRKHYIRNTKKFVVFCREHYDCRNFDSCREHIQDYSDYLQTQGYTPSTIHSYIAAACSTFDVPMQDIRKPIRKTSEFIRGRCQGESIRTSQDLNDPEWDYIVSFQKKVGLRRAELYELRKEDFLMDESGHFTIFVRNGKGHKKQHQRLNSEEDVEFIKRYFDAVGTGEKVFEDKYFRNDLNFHKLRADSAKEYYAIQLDRILNEPGYAEKLESEIKKRWELFNINPKTGKPKKFPQSQIQGWYVLRGDNRAKAIREGRPLRYNRLAVMACSIFKLSHWRTNVTVQNYLAI